MAQSDMSEKFLFLLQLVGMLNNFDTFISLFKMSRRCEDVWKLLCAEKGQVLFCHFS